MNAIRIKLRGKDGASILMGLLFLLVCLMVGTVVLVASTAAAGKLAELREAEQDYLNVASAARLVKDRICVTGYIRTRTQVKISRPDGTTTVTYTDSGGEISAVPDPTIPTILKSELKERCNTLTNEHTDGWENAFEATEKTFKIEIKNDSMPDGYDEDWKTVHGSLSMKVDGRIIVKLWLGDKTPVDTSHNHVEIEFCADGPVTKTKVETEEVDGVITETTTTTTMCSWPEEGCTITKGK